MNFITKQVEKKLGMDLNGDGMVGSGRGHTVTGGYHPQGHGGGGLINQLENVAQVDLNGDGRVGGGSAYPPNYNQYGGPAYYPPNCNQYGGGPACPLNYNQYGGPQCPPSYPQYGGAGYGPNPHHSGGGGLMNQLEKVTHMDLNGDGRVDGNSAYPSNYNQHRHGY